MIDTFATNLERLRFEMRLQITIDVKYYNTLYQTKRECTQTISQYTKFFLKFQQYFFYFLDFCEMAMWQSANDSLLVKIRSNEISFLNTKRLHNDHIEEIAIALHNCSSLNYVELTNNVLNNPTMIEFLQTSKFVKRITFKDSFLPSQYPVIAQIIERNESVSTFDFHDWILQDSSAIVSAALARNKTLQSISFFSVQFKEQCFRTILQSLLLNPSLSTISFIESSFPLDPFVEFLTANTSTNQISIFHFKSDASQSLLDVLSRDKTLRRLFITHTPLGLPGATSLKHVLLHNTALAVLGLSSCDLGDAGVEQLAEGLQHSAIDTIDLQSNKIGVNGLTALLHSLMVNRTVTNLNLGWNDAIGDEGASALAQMLVVNSTISTFNCQQCDIREAGLLSLVEALCRNSTLTSMNLSGNIGTALSIQAIADALTMNSTLKTVKLSNFGITATDVVALCQALKENSTIATLDLSANMFGEGGVGAIVEVMDCNSTITDLNIVGFRMSIAAVQQIAQSLAHNTTITALQCALGSEFDELKAEIGTLLTRNTEIRACHFSLK
jgi:Ran GTPase-activating protein (RanGAP) involved in mRNA processing and transport